MTDKIVKVMFFDRDGTINVKMPEDSYVTNWGEFQFLPYTFEVLRAIKDRDYKTILVTNQRGIARGIMTSTQLLDIHERMQSILRQNGCSFDHIFYCPHDIHEKCNCRKPKPGLLAMVDALYCINKEHSFMVGDSLSDMEAGRRYGVKTIRVGSIDVNADYSAMNLSEILTIIISSPQDAYALGRQGDVSFVFSTLICK